MASLTHEQKIEQDEGDLPFDQGYILWYHAIKESSWKPDSYRNLCLKLPEKAIRSAKNLWRAYASFDNNVTAGMFFLMRDGVMPLWEDPANAKGGCWSFKVPKKHSNEIWRQLSAAFTGNTLTRNPNHMSMITGISVSPKISNCVLKIWNNDKSKADANLLTKEISFLTPSSVLYRGHSKN